MSYQGYQQPGGQPPGYGQPGGYQPGGYGAAPAPAYASVGKRIVAVILDALVGLAAEIPGGIILGIGAGMLAASADSRGQVPSGEGGPALIVMMLGYAVAVLGGLAVGIYNIYLLGKRGSTLGKGWMKIKVVDPTGQPIGFWKAFGRELIKGLLAGVCIILLLWPLWDAQKQGLWDKVFNTNVYDA